MLDSAGSEHWCTGYPVTCWREVKSLNACCDGGNLGLMPWDVHCWVPVYNRAMAAPPWQFSLGLEAIYVSFFSLIGCHIAVVVCEYALLYGLHDDVLVRMWHTNFRDMRLLNSWTLHWHLTILSQHQHQPGSSPVEPHWYILIKTRQVLAHVSCLGWTCDRCFGLGRLSSHLKGKFLLGYTGLFIPRQAMDSCRQRGRERNNGSSSQIPFFYVETDSFIEQKENIHM